jgi:hypothetical protein
MENPIIEFIGIYDADSTLRGEISYWIGARLGRAHCSLCDITHGLFTQKKQWSNCVSELPVPFITFHRNDAPTDVLEAAQGKFPVVLARTSNSLEIVVSNEKLEALEGSPEQLAHQLEQYLRNQ